MWKQKTKILNKRKWVKVNQTFPWTESVFELFVINVERWQGLTYKQAKNSPNNEREDVKNSNASVSWIRLLSRHDSEKYVPEEGSCYEDKSAVLVPSWKALWAVCSVQVCPFHYHMPWETELRSHLKRQVVRKVRYRVTTCQGSKVGCRVILFYWFLFVLWGRQCFECLNVCIRIVLNLWLAIT